MPFNEFSFWLLFTPLMALYWLLPQLGKNLFLLALSYLYYSLFDWRFCFIILTSTLVDYCAARLIYRYKDQLLAKLSLLASLSTNLALLITFKYFYKDITNIGFQALSEPESWKTHLVALSFPIGVSFYTFQSLSYTIDCYRNKLRPCLSFIDFALYVSFFPQLLAGPIERATRLLPELQKVKKFQFEYLYHGLFLVLLGLVKKNFFSSFVWYKMNDIQTLGHSSGPALISLGVLMVFYVYFDFSGYCDIGRGIAKILGIKISLNFRPFLYAKNPADLWARWNFTLTYWVRDYFVLPLSRWLASRYLTDVVVLLALLLIGLWHGASWGWLLFGVSQGVFIVLYRNLKKIIGSRIDRGLWSLGARLITYASLLTMGLIHFSLDREVPLKTFAHLFSNWSDLQSFYTLGLCLIIMLPLFLHEYFQERFKDYDFIVRRPKIYQFLYLAFCLVYLFESRHYFQPQFVYFQF